MKSSPGEYQAFKDFLSKASGITLGESKEYLISSRLSGLMRENGIATLSDLLKKISSGRNSHLRNAIVDAMTTNETYWFRDPAHFKILNEIVLPQATNRSLRIWSAACSSGQEPYSISMQIQDYITRNPGRLAGRVEIIGTDISSSVLDEARSGVYTGMAVNRGLSLEQRRRFFISRGNEEEVRPEIRSRVSFREFNLMRGFESLGRFDVIFCRNVLIYFTTATKQDIIGRMFNALNPGGYLFLGSTESLSTQLHAFEMVTTCGGIAYRRKD